MIARLRSWWQKTSKTLDAVVILMLVVLVTLVVVIVLGYTNNWSWAGLRGKTLYDWLQLLIIPAVLAVGGYLFNYTTSKNEQAIASDDQNEAAMKEYFDKMSELMLHENLSKSDSNAEVRKIARVLTLTVLRHCDSKRKANVLQFLYESDLIEVGNRIVDLGGADLAGADLRDATLHTADLSGANLTGADLSHAVLSKANFSYTVLNKANLRGAILSKADFTRAFLTGANLIGAFLSPSQLSAEQLEKRLELVESLKGAIMPDGTIHA